MSRWRLQNGQLLELHQAFAKADWCSRVSRRIAEVGHGSGVHQHVLQEVVARQTRLVSFQGAYCGEEAADMKLDGRYFRTAVAAEEEGNRLVLREKFEMAEAERTAVEEGNQERLGEGDKMALDGER